MAIPLKESLKWRQTAPFHIQLELEKPQDTHTVSGEIQVHGRAVRVFRTDGRVGVGDRLGFSLWVCRAGDEPTGPAYIHDDDFKTASYMEAYLYGDPPECKLAAYEFTVIRAPSDEPTLISRELEELLEGFGDARAVPLKMRKATSWWQFWRR
jgi:hypothetical protein